MDCSACIIRSQRFSYPATRKCKMLPTPPADFRRPFNLDRSSQLCGFGYDGVNDDYKVVRIFQPGGRSLSAVGSKVTVYRLKTNSWKQLKNISSDFQFIEPWGVFICGALHWVTFKTQERCFVILAFDLGVETYSEVPFPEVEHKYPNQFTLALFDESLCLLEFNPFVRIDIWKMNDYGVENTWCKVFSLDHPKIIRSCMAVRPIIYSKNRRDVLLELDKKVIWYNLEKKKVKTLKIPDLPDMFDLDAYTQSLVSPDYNCSSDGKHLQNHQHKKKKKQQERKNNNRDTFLAKGFKFLRVTCKCSFRGKNVPGDLKVFGWRTQYARKKNAAGIITKVLNYHELHLVISISI
ncbi:F-box protein CPR1-like [Apium graveolens]|uniref:F-box protein CPR1-like n=1 Tax=Apium graveolens TaxID=4045 RepID=UPI003D78C029